MTTGLLGGTFDPPHIAHVGAAEFVLRNHLVSDVLVLPVFSHAFAKEPLAPFDDRIEMCRRAFAHLPEVTVLDIERNLPLPSYTISTVRALRELFPERTFRIVMGSDIVHDFHRWREADELSRLAPPLVLAREGYPEPGAMLAALPRVASTDLRQDLRALHEFPNDLELRTRLGRSLPEPVLSMILEKGLYQA
jgi:nicotinate-nucleotide adenylyltransferase